MTYDVHFQKEVENRYIKYLLFFFFLIGFLFFGNISSAHAEPDEMTTDTLFAPQFCTLVNEDNEFLQLFQSNLDNGKSFRDAFALVQHEYHSQVNDEFNENIEKLSQDYYSNEKVYEKACVLWGDRMQTKTLALSRKMMKRFEKYECALNVYILYPPLNGDEITQIEGVRTLQTIEANLRREISNSFQALELTIAMYSEMRTWYPIHRDLLCLIDQLKDYRDALRKFIDDVVRMPIKFYNYSSRNQQ